jgi:hypothetical protein
MDLTNSSFSWRWDTLQNITFGAFDLAFLTTHLNRGSEKQPIPLKAQNVVRLANSRSKVYNERSGIRFESELQRFCHWDWNTI